MGASMQNYLTDDSHRRLINKPDSSLGFVYYGSWEEVKGENSSEEAYIHELDRKIVLIVQRFTAGKPDNLKVYVYLCCSLSCSKMPISV